ncbi:hypothetical protein BXT90_06555 [Corynebacterium amycolatum]|nr:hypothetical protein BXT90_06555 [Corynebacterium amycolatum]
MHGIPTLLEKPTATARSDIFVQLPQVENLDFMEKNYNEHHTLLIADNFTQRMCATVISATPAEARLVTGSPQPLLCSLN